MLYSVREKLSTLPVVEERFHEKAVSKILVEMCNDFHCNICDINFRSINSNVYTISCIQTINAKYKVQPFQYVGCDDKWITGKTMGWFQSIERSSGEYFFIAYHCK